MIDRLRLQGMSNIYTLFIKQIYAVVLVRQIGIVGLMEDLVVLRIQPQKLGPELNWLLKMVLFDPVQPVDAGALIELASDHDKFIFRRPLGHFRKLGAINFLYVFEQITLLRILFEGMCYIFASKAGKELALEIIQHKIRNFLFAKDHVGLARFERYVGWIVIWHASLEVYDQKEGHVVVIEPQGVEIIVQLCVCL